MNPTTKGLLMAMFLINIGILLGNFFNWGALFANLLLLCLFYTEGISKNETKKIIKKAENAVSSTKE